MKRMLFVLAPLLAIAAISAAAPTVGNLPPYDRTLDVGKTLGISAAGYALSFVGAAQGFDVRDCGAKGDGTTDDAPAFQSCINAMSSASSIGRTLRVPCGNYRLASSVSVQRQIVMQGETGSGWFSCSALKPDKGVTALRITRPSTSIDGQRGDWSSIRDISIQYPGGAATEWAATTAYALGDLVVSTTGSSLSYLYTMEATTPGTSGSSEPDWDATTPIGSNTLAEGATVSDGSVTWTIRIIAGVRLDARASLEHLYIVGSPGNGVIVLADSTWTPTTNANNFKIADSVVSGSNISGLHVQGADANAGYVQGLDVSTNRLWGVNDVSFLGNTYVACHAATNGAHSGAESTWYGGPYRFNNANARTVVDGCYSETDQAPSEGVGPGVVIGGLHGAGWSDGNTFAADTTFTRVNAGEMFAQTITFKNPITSLNTQGAQTQLPGSSSYFMNWKTTADTSGVSFGSTSAGGYPGWWAWRHANLDSRTFMAFSSSAAAQGGGFVYFPRGIFLGGQNAYIGWLETGDAKPSLSSWATPTAYTGALRINQTVHTQHDQPNQGIFGWQNIGSGSPNAIAVQTIRWDNWGHTNQLDITNGVGSPLAIDWTLHAGTLLTNTGATEKVYVELQDSTGVPSDFRMSTIEMLVTDSDGIRIVAPSGRSFQHGAYTSATGGYLESTTIGSWIKLRMLGVYSSPTFEVIGYSGSWSDGSASLGQLTSAELAALVTDETGTAGSVVFSGSPTLTGTVSIDASSGSGPAVDLTCNATSACLQLDTQSAPSTCSVGQVYADVIGDIYSCTASDTWTGLGMQNASLSQFASTTSAQLASVLSDETGTGAAVFSAAPSLTGAVGVSGTLGVTGQTYVAVPATITTTGTSFDVDWNDGNGQAFDAQGSTGNLTVTFSNPIAGASYVLKLIQGSTARMYTWPGTVKWPSGAAPTVTTTDDGIDVVTCFYDGTNYLCSFTLDYQ